MTAQAPESATALWTRLQSRFDDRPRTAHVETAAGQANWPHGFGGDIADVQSVVVHCTSGWPTHDKTTDFVQRYTVPGHTDSNGHVDWGIGPHFYMPLDGKVFRLLSENKVCWHATYVNDRAIGVETGNLNEVGSPGGGHWPGHWTALSSDAEDLPGTKIFAIFVNNEVLVAYWTTSRAGAPGDSHPEGAQMMLISEAQYLGWALLARWLAEVWRIPRNFPLRPHLARGDNWQRTQFKKYRALVDADPVRDMHIRKQLQPIPFNCNATTFESNVVATGLPHVYAAGEQLVNAAWVDSNGKNRPEKHANVLWTKFFNSYRGFHAHSFSGAIGFHQDDHNCPGAWFDWQRFSRMVWDYWWYPFDLTQPSPADAINSVTDLRDYGQNALHEHYFDHEPSWYAKVTTRGFFPVGEETVTPHTVAGPPLGLVGEMVRMWRHYWGFWHGGMHFLLQENTPIYALACGQIVAARLGPAAGPLARGDSASPHPSALFVLLRHEVFFQRGGGGDRIDYTQEPARVYSLYMHLGLPDTLSYNLAVSTNPTWLNRVIAIKKEYESGPTFQGAHAAPAAAWAPHVARWARQQPVFDQLITDLQAGNIARFPEGEDAIRVALGDLLGCAGHLDTGSTGIHLEVFSAEQINDPWFEAVDKGGAASRPFHDEQNLDDVTTFIGGHVAAPAKGHSPTEVYRALPSEEKASSFQKIALRTKSEWALKASDFPQGGWDLAKDLMWWDQIVPGMNADLSDARDQLPANAVVWHYHPIGFLHWLNEITWKSEWPKFRIKDAAGAAEPVPARPPPRS